MCFDCEIITPMHLTGADNKTPELRAPSIKSMMRFWWRAAMRKQDPADLKTTEAKIFGTDSAEKGRRSPFTIDLDNCPPSGSIKKYFLLPHKNEGRGLASADCFISGTTFKITLTARDINTLETAKTTFELAALLGGLGRRSRRGFGCFTANSLTFDDEDTLLSEILKRLNCLNSSTFKLNSLVRPSFIEPITPANLFYPAIEKIEVKSVNNNDLLRKIGNATSRHHGIGGGGRTPRMASPVVVSACAKTGSELFVVITRLKSTNDNVTEARMDAFTREVMNNV